MSDLTKLCPNGKLIFIPGMGIEDYEFLHMSSAQFVLYSYFYLRSKKLSDVLEILQRNKSRGITNVLDSGAFSVWNSGKAVDIDDFGRFATETSEYFAYVFSLDVIGEEKASFDNWIYLRDHYPAATFCPVFHSNSSQESLKRIVKEKPELLGLGGIAIKGATTRQRDKYIEFALNYTLEEGILTHALGVGDFLSLIHFAVNFVDSTTWQTVARMGEMLTPFKGFLRVPLSKKRLKDNPHAKEFVDRFFKNPKREEYTQIILDKIGASLEDIMSDNTVLALFNLETTLYRLGEKREMRVRKRRMLL